MLTIFNRKELISTYDMAQQARICGRLADKNIEYQISVLSRKSPSAFGAGSRAHTGTFGEKLEMEYQYTIFVKKKDYDYALFELRTND